MSTSKGAYLLLSAGFSTGADGTCRTGVYMAVGEEGMHGRCAGRAGPPLAGAGPARWFRRVAYLFSRSLISCLSVSMSCLLVSMRAFIVAAICAA